MSLLNRCLRKSLAIELERLDKRTCTLRRADASGGRDTHRQNLQGLQPNPAHKPTRQFSSSRQSAAARTVGTVCFVRTRSSRTPQNGISRRPFWNAASLGLRVPVGHRSPWIAHFATAFASTGSTHGEQTAMRMLRLTLLRDIFASATLLSAEIFRTK